MSELRRVPFFGVVANPQSYINILYLFLSSPLGIAYFVFLVTGISLGLGLVIIWVSVPILVLVLAGSWTLCHLERILAIALLKEDIHPPWRNAMTVPSNSRTAVRASVPKSACSSARGAGSRHTWPIT